VRRGPGDDPTSCKQIPSMAHKLCHIAPTAKGIMATTRLACAFLDRSLLTIIGHSAVTAYRTHPCRPVSKLPSCVHILPFTSLQHSGKAAFSTHLPQRCFILPCSLRGPKQRGCPGTSPTFLGGGPVQLLLVDLPNPAPFLATVRLPHSPNALS
jgi:hypothetical protein